MSGNFWPLSLLVSVVFLAYILWTGKRLGWFTLDSVFAFCLWILSFGTLRILDSTVRADVTYAWVVTIPTLTYYVTGFIMNLSFSREIKPRRRRLEIHFNSPGILGYGLLAFSALITIVYYQAVGYNVFLTGLSDSIRGTGSQDYSTLRLESYSASSGYLFPGYVNQFKNSLLPALSAMVVIYLFSKRIPFRWASSIFILGIALVGLLGTGQRSMMVLFAYMLIILTYQINPAKFFKRAFLMSSIIVPILLFSTFLLGRNQDEVTQANGVLAKSGILLSEFFDRLFYVQQWSGQMVFRYTQTQPTQWGSEWWKGISGILPGMEGSDLPRVVFQILYGTDRGTATPSIWGSVFYDFSWWGIIIIPILLAVLFQKISYNFSRKNEVSLMELVAYSGFSAVSGNWIAGGPDYLLNAGAVTFLILWLLARNQSKRISNHPQPNYGSKKVYRRRLSAKSGVL